MSKRSGWCGRGSRQERGYGAEWDRIRKRILERDLHICRCDQCKGGELRLLPATHVDHIKRKEDGGSDDDSNLRAVNKDCHTRISIEQKGQRMRQGCDASGAPRDVQHHWNV